MRIGLPTHLLLSLLAFNIGIEIGQLLVLLAALPALIYLYRSHPASERVITAVLCLLIGHTAWHWLGERAEALREADWTASASEFTNAAVLLTISILIVGAASWLMVRH